MMPLDIPLQEDHDHFIDDRQSDRTAQMFDVPFDQRSGRN
jgi:hypothetical protein